MKKTLLLLAALGLATSLMAVDFPRGSPEFVTSYRNAMSIAKQTGKPAIVIFSASWCPPCMEMLEEVYPSRKVRTYHDQFVWTYLNRDDPSNDPIAEKFGVEGIPHIEIVDPKGLTLDRLVGFETPREFASRLKTALSRIKPVATASR